MCCVADGYAHSEDAIALRLSCDFHFATKGMSLAYKNADDPAVGLAQGLKLLLRGKTEDLRYRTAAERFHVANWQDDFPLRRLLPGLIDASG